jgi:hypothetical protein
MIMMTSDERTRGGPSMRDLLTVLAALVALQAAESAAAAGTWRFIEPTAGDPFPNPPLRALALGREKPEDVVEKVRYRGVRQRYAQVRYGSPTSIRVTVVLDEVGPGEADLYVDANRNRRVEPSEKVAPGPDARTWHVPLDVAIAEGETTRAIRRALIFRRGPTGLTLSVAAPGYVEGTISVEGKTHVARRVDGDASGALSDPQDRLWLDLNDDGRWDPVSEQFLFAPILTLAGARYAIRSDAFGDHLALEPLQGTGLVRLAPAGPAMSSAVSEYAATLVGRDGSVVPLGGHRPEAEVPPGDYRVQTVTINLDDPQGGPGWGFVFSDDGGHVARGWHTVGKGRRVTIDPIGKLEFLAGLEGKTGRPGQEVTLQPKLYTEGGLLINTAFRGSPASPRSDGPTAAITLAAPDGHPANSARSGFA